MRRNHARVLASLSDVDFVGVVDPNAAQGLVTQGRPVFAELSDLLELNIDYCVVATPTVTHLPLGLALADAGVHALIEKPLTLDAVEAATLTEAFRDRGLVGAVGHIERLNPACSRPATGSKRGSWLRVTRSPREGKARSRRGSATWESFSIWPRTTSTSRRG